MSRSIAKGIFATLDVLSLLVVMLLITGGQFTAVWFSAPLLFGAMTVFFGMLYLNLYQDGLDEWDEHDAQLRGAHAISAHPHHKAA